MDASPNAAPSSLFKTANSSLHVLSAFPLRLVRLKEIFQDMSLPLNGASGLGDQHTNYPFLQHIPRDTSEKGEASPSSRQKRRRTSPQDHAKLEAAYQRNSKPDKQERIDIVSQVELGEKEVQVGRYMQRYNGKPNANTPQIWFQNRRQTELVDAVRWPYI